MEVSDQVPTLQIGGWGKGGRGGGGGGGGGGGQHGHETWMPESYSSSSQGFWMHLGTVKIGTCTCSGENVGYSTHHWGSTVSC